MSAAAPRFSVLLPTHNRADVLSYAIASVLVQSERDFELLIVADGCTDATREVVGSFTDPRIRFFDLPKAPHFGYANRNVALRQARGRLVAFAPHDDLLLPDHLASMGDLLESSGAAWGYSRPLWVSTDGVIVPLCINLALADELQVFLERGNAIPAACVVHTRAVLEQVGHWPEDVPIAADWELWRRIFHASGGRIAQRRQPTALHFTANWRSSRFADVAMVGAMLEIADNVPWWPAALRHAAGGEPEQAAIWRALWSGGPAWVEQLRTAVDTVVDRVMLTMASGTWPAVEAMRTAQARTEAELQACRAELAALRLTLARKV